MAVAAGGGSGAEDAFGQELEDGGREFGAFEVQSHGVQPVRQGVEGPRDDVCREHVGGVRVGVAQEVG